MPSGWIERAKIARELSRTGDSELVFSEMEIIEDYARKITDLRESCGVDKRLIAVGGDSEYATYDAVQNINEDFANIIWHYSAQNKMWHDICISSRGTVENPAKILSYILLPIDDYIKPLADNTREYTFINNLELHYFEKFYATTEYAQRYGGMNYSVIDTQDLISGTHEKTFDFVRTNSYMCLKPTLEILKSNMDAVKVGGMFVFVDSSNFGELYALDDGMYTSFHRDMGEYIKSRTDFVSYHVPYDMGVVVATRIG